MVNAAPTEAAERAVAAWEPRVGCRLGPGRSPDGRRLLLVDANGPAVALDEELGDLRRQAVDADADRPSTTLEPIEVSSIPDEDEARVIGRPDA